ncbi:MAG TPA: PEGA domain-containing protein [Vicinamibacterales bacterium]|nr:PEGA domain-containing protein [Vicinamibacterales bacterium]
MIALAGVVLVAAAALIYGGRGSVPDTDPFAFDPDVAGTEVSVPAAPVDSPPAPSVAPAPAPPVDEAPDPPAAVAVGRLEVRSTPTGALVTVDGRIAGTTPLTIADLPIGSHVVQVARPGFVPVEERVDLTATTLARVVDVRLGRSAADGAPRPAGVGSLEVDSRPRGATVTVDGRRVGVTPLSVPDLPAGRHVVELGLEGYRSVRSEVLVRAGERARLALSLEAGTRGPRH